MAVKNGVVTRAVIFERKNSGSELLPTGIVPEKREEIEGKTTKFYPDFFRDDPAA